MRIVNILIILLSVSFIIGQSEEKQGSGNSTAIVSTLTLDSGATVTIFDFGETKIHAYTGPPAGNGTYIIESANNLVLVDAQFLNPIAQEYRAYADELGKPIERIIITHEHPDHWMGLGAAFTDVNVYTTAGVKAILGARVPIDNILPEGSEVIEGITFEYDVYTNLEAEEQVVIRLPDYGAIITGDLVYNEHYLFLGPNLDDWKRVLTELNDLDGYDLVLPGHGLPTDSSIFANNIEHIETAQDIIASSSNGQEFKQALMAAYPNYGGESYLGFFIPSFFPEDSAKKIPEGLAVTEHSPYQQVEDGAAVESVVCKEGLELIIRSNTIPACVEPSTAKTLVERGLANYP